jgi:hypothetical protein
VEAKYPPDGELKETPYRVTGSGHIKGVPGIGHQEPSLVGYQGISSNEKAIPLHEDRQVAGHMSRCGHHPGSAGPDKLAVGQDTVYLDRLHRREGSHETATGLLLVRGEVCLQFLCLNQAPGLLPALQPGCIIIGRCHLQLGPGALESRQTANMVPVMVGCHDRSQGCRAQPSLGQSRLKSGKLARESAINQQFSTDYHRMYCHFLTVPEKRK